MTTGQHSNTSSEAYANDEHPKFGDIYSPLAFLDNTETPKAIERKRPKFEGLKVEETLTPPKPVPKPIEALQKSVRFSNIVEELISNLRALHQTLSRANSSRKHSAKHKRG